MWPVIHQAFGCWICNAKHRFAGQAIKVSAFMLVPSPLPWCWHRSVHSAHPCIFRLCREYLVPHWESKWCQHCDRGEEGDRAAWKSEGLWVLCFCQLQDNCPCNNTPLWLGLWGTAWAPVEDETAGHPTCSGALVTTYVMAAFIFQIKKLTTKELNLVSEK